MTSSSDKPADQESIDDPASDRSAAEERVAAQPSKQPATAQKGDAATGSSESTTAEPGDRPLTSNTPDDPDEDAVDLLVRGIHERAARIVEEWCSEVRTQAVSKFAGVLTAVADSNDGLRSEIDWDAETARSEYRQGFRVRVIHPLQRGLEQANVASDLAEAYSRLMEGLGSDLDDLPKTITRNEPEDLYTYRPGDAVGRRVRKAGVRTRRALRRSAEVVTSLPQSFKGERSKLVATDQTIPLGRLAAHHLNVRLPEHLAIIQEALHQILGRAAADAARVVTEHGHEILAAESDLREVADAFSDALRKAASNTAVDDTLQDAKTRCAAAFDEFRRDIRHAGTFMLDLDKRPGDGGRASNQEREQSWQEWHARVRARIGLTHTLLTLRKETHDAGTALIDHVRSDAIDPARAALADAERSLRSLTHRAAADFDADEGPQIAQRIRRHLDDALSAVNQEAIAVFREQDFPERLRSAADESTAELAGRLHRLPETVEINKLRPLNERAVDPTEAPLVVELREHASRGYDAIVLRRLQAAASVMGDGLRDARKTAEGIPEVLRFNLEAALEEIEPRDDRDPDLAAARELAVEGLERSANVLREASRALADLQAPFAEQVDAVIELGFDRLHERLRVEVRMRGQILDLRSGAVEQLRDVTTRAAEEARKSSVLLRRVYQRGIRRARSLLEMGQAAAGLAEATEEERLETVEALSDVEHLIQQLPLVYRRLFTFEPTTDAAMLVGRERDLAFVRKHVDFWLRGMTNALVLSGYPGSGLTSVLNVARQSILKDAEVSVLELSTRPTHEAELAALVAKSLNLGDGSWTSLDDLEEAVTAVEPSTVRACVVEHIEHLYLRRIGGTALIERFLAFMSRTDGQILWVATVSDTAWQVIATAEPAAAGLVTAHGLTSLSRQELEALVLTRHKRSGLPIRFEPPGRDLNPLVTRRYRRAKTEQERQGILQEEYFDRLFRATGQNIMLALLYWLRSVETDADEGVLRVQQLEPLSFLTLESFSLEQAFALRSLLEHRSLTVEEHSEITGTPRETSHQLLQSLGNLLLIEPTDSQDRARFQFFPIEEGVRYRLRPLLIHPVIRFLRSRNIVH